MLNRRKRFGAMLLATAFAGLSLPIALQAASAPSSAAVNPITGCSEDSFFVGGATPDPSIPIVVAVGANTTVSAVYHDESAINTNPGFLPIFTLKDPGGNVVLTQAPVQTPTSAPAGTGDKFNTLLTATFALPAKGAYTANLKAWDGDQNKAGGDCGIAIWNVKSPAPANIVLHKVDDHQPAQALPGAVFGLWSGGSAVGNPLLTCTSQANGTCNFNSIDAGTYTIHEISAPAGYSPDPGTRTVTVAAGETKDITDPFVDPRDTGFVRIVKQLKDDKGNVVNPPDKHVLDGTSFVVYSDKNNNGSLDAGETAKLWAAETADASCTITGGTGQCDVGPLVTGGYRVHETHAPDHTTPGPDVDVTVTKGTSANPTVVTYVNLLSPLNINLVKSGPGTVHVGDVFNYSFDATTTGPRLGSIALVELATNRCTGPISAASGDTNADGFLDAGETWHWTCSHTTTAADPNPLPNSAKVTGTDDFGRSVSATASHSVIVINPAITVVKSGPAVAHEGDKITYTFKITNTGDVALHDLAVGDDVLGNLVALGDHVSLPAQGSMTVTKDFTTPVGNAVDNNVLACAFDPLQLAVCDSDHHHLLIIHPGIKVEKSGPAVAHVGDKVVYSFKVTNTGDTTLNGVHVSDDKVGPIGVLASLAPGENTTLTGPFTVPAGSAVDNTATACGEDLLKLQVCDDDHHHLLIIHPGIKVEKSGPSLAHEGDKVSYDFKVTNTGDVALTNVTVVDDKLGDVGTIASLAVGESKTLTKGFTIPANVDGVDNTATACGVDPLSLKVCDDDHHHVPVIHPGISVVKSGPATAANGATVTYTFKVTNTGDTDLSNVNVVDDKLGNIGTVTLLKVGASTTLTKDFTVPAGVASVDNTATACGVDALALQVCGTDKHHLDVPPQVLGQTFVPSGPLAVTGGNTGRGLIVGMFLLLGGVALRTLRRRSRMEA